MSSSLSNTPIRKSSAFTWRVQQSLEALEPVRQGVHRCFGTIVPGVARGLKLRHDHGSNYMSATFRMKSSVWASKPRLLRARPEAMASPSVIRTLKENLLWSGLRYVEDYATLREFALTITKTAGRSAWLSNAHSSASRSTSVPNANVGELSLAA